MEKLEAGTVTSDKNLNFPTGNLPSESKPLLGLCSALPASPCHSHPSPATLKSIASLSFFWVPATWMIIFLYLFSCRLPPSPKDKGPVSFTVLSPSSKRTGRWCVHSRVTSNTFILPQMRMFAWRHIFMIIFLFSTRMVTETTVILAVQNWSNKTIS